MLVERTLCWREMLLYSHEERGIRVKFITKYSWVIYLVAVVFMLVNSFFNKNDEMKGILSIGAFILVMIVYLITRKVRMDQVTNKYKK